MLRFPYRCSRIMHFYVFKGFVSEWCGTMTKDMLTMAGVLSTRFATPTLRMDCQAKLYTMRSLFVDFLLTIFPCRGCP